MAAITDAHRVTERDLSLAVGDCPSSTAVRSGLSPEMCLCVSGGLRDPCAREEGWRISWRLVSLSGGEYGSAVAAGREKPAGEAHEDLVPGSGPARQESGGL